MKRSTETIQLPDNHDIAFAELIDHPLKLWSIPSPTRCLLYEDFLNSGFLQGVKLKFFPLILSRDSCVSDFHCKSVLSGFAILHKVFARAELRALRELHDRAKTLVFTQRDVSSVSQQCTIASACFARLAPMKYACW